MKKITLITAVTIGLAGAASAAVIYDATPANSTFVYNAVGNPAVDADGTLTGTAGDLEITNYTQANGGVNFGNVGFVSTDSINTMIGGAGLTAADTLTFKATVTGITGDIRSNGIEFGMNPSTSWRDDGNLIYTMRAAEATHAFQANAFIASGSFIELPGKTTEASMKDGFDITLVANNAGYTFTINGIDDIANGNATTIVESGTWSGSTFLDNFGGGHFSLTVQRFNTTPDTVMSISEAQISVIPEPATLGLVAAFGGAIMFIRRRFMV
jgi:hypothetical protein